MKCDLVRISSRQLWGHGARLKSSHVMILPQVQTTSRGAHGSAIDTVGCCYPIATPPTRRPTKIAFLLPNLVGPEGIEPSTR
jgi:hypothetical protein